MKKLVILAAVLVSLALAGISFAGGPKEFQFPVVADEGAVTFSHETHTVKIKVECKECHPALFKMKKGGTEGVTMEAMNAGKNCGACHNGTRAFSTTDETKCGMCHKK